MARGQGAGRRFDMGVRRTVLLLCGSRASYAPGPGVRWFLSSLALILASSKAALAAAGMRGKISAAGQGFRRGVWCLTRISMQAPRRVLGLEVHGGGHVAASQWIRAPNSTTVLVHHPRPSKKSILGNRADSQHLGKQTIGARSLVIDHTTTARQPRHYNPPLARRRCAVVTTSPRPRRPPLACCGLGWGPPGRPPRHAGTCGRRVPGGPRWSARR